MKYLDRLHQVMLEKIGEPLAATPKGQKRQKSFDRQEMVQRVEQKFCATMSPAEKAEYDRAVSLLDQGVDPKGVLR